MQQEQYLKYQQIQLNGGLGARVAAFDGGSLPINPINVTGSVDGSPAREAAQQLANLSGLISTIPPSVVTLGGVMPALNNRLRAQVLEYLNNRGGNYLS